jgi:hypothetical protein
MLVALKELLQRLAVRQNFRKGLAHGARLLEVYIYGLKICGLLGQDANKSV